MSRVEVVALLGAVLWLLVVVEMIRRSRFSEGYALLWLLSGAVLFVLAFWRDLLDVLARGLGIFYPPTALFVVAFGFGVSWAVGDVVECACAVISSRVTISSDFIF